MSLILCRPPFYRGSVDGR